MLFKQNPRRGLCAISVMYAQNCFLLLRLVGIIQVLSGNLYTCNNNARNAAWTWQLCPAGISQI